MGDGRKNLVHAEAGVHRVNVQRCTKTRLAGKVSKEAESGTNRADHRFLPIVGPLYVMGVTLRHFPQIIHSVLKPLDDHAGLFFIAGSLDLHDILFG